MEYSEEEVREIIDEEVWVAGKGPSLDTFPWQMAGRSRFGINEAAFLVPSCLGAFALDTHIFTKFNNSLADHIICFISERKTSRTKRHFLYKRTVHCPVTVGTITVAVQILSYFGAKTIHFVGCDSMHSGAGYARSIEKIHAEGTNHDNYYSINNKLRDVLKATGVTPIWEHQYETVRH